MFQYKEVLGAFKDMVGGSADAAESHCKMLEIRARELGFQGYHHLRTTLAGTPTDKFGEVSLRLMRSICERRIPTLNCAYFEFHVLPGRRTGFYSHWIGWDKNGDEVRVPRPLHGKSTAHGLRRATPQPIYVLESAKEILAWKYNWGSTGLIPEAIAQESFPLSFNKKWLVAANPPIDKVRENANQYMNNLASE